MLLRENKSLASAILDLGKQMQKMEQILQDFRQKYAPINNPQSEVDTRIDEFITGIRNASNMGSAEKIVFCSILRCSTCFWQSPASHKLTLTTHTHSHLAPHTPAPYCCATHIFWAHLALYFTAPPILQGLLNHPPLLCHLPPQPSHLPVW